MTVEVTLSGALAARAGTRRTYVSVPPEATLGDVVDRLAERRGASLRSALVDGERLRADASGVRRGSVADESLSLDSRVKPGDRIRLDSDCTGEPAEGVRDPAQSASRFNA